MAETHTLCGLSELTELGAFAGILVSAADEEAELERLALAWVVRNRSQLAGRFVRTEMRVHPRFGDGSLRLACRSVSRDAGAPERDASGTARLPGPAYYRALATACLVLSGDCADPTQGSVDFHRHDESPKWAEARVAAALIGSRLFYRAD